MCPSGCFHVLTHQSLQQPYEVDVLILLSLKIKYQSTLTGVMFWSGESNPGFRALTFKHYTVQWGVGQSREETEMKLTLESEQKAQMQMKM